MKSNSNYRVAPWSTLVVAAVLAGTTVAHGADAAPALPKPSTTAKVVRLEVMPTSIKFTTPQQYMHVVVTGVLADGRLQDLSRTAQWKSADPKVVRIERDLATPVGNGRTELSLTVAGLSAKIPVEAVEQQTPERTSFQFGVLPALTKQGCNQGACHGSPSGKGGFRLSLRAYDPVLDIATLVREAYQRRVDTISPEASLLLQKPLMTVPHGGGRRITKADFSYQVLRDWIAQGCKLDEADAAQCLRIEVYPPQRELHRPADAQQLLVLGHFSDGSTRDLTKLADYLSSDDAVAVVDADGLVSSRDRGETTVLVRYLDQTATSALTFLADVPGFKWQDRKPANFIDQIVWEKLHRMQILPSDLCTDEEFVRRVYLDVLGLLPTIEETDRFLSDARSDKRAALIDDLLARPEYAPFWALKWADLLRVRKAKVSEPGVYKFQRWLEQTVRDNVPYDQFARELLTASGSTLTNPAANFYRTAADVNDCTETASQLFLGARMQCAKCHNHPFERWTQDNYYGIAAFFTRVQRKKSSVEEDLIIWSARSGEITQPRTGKTMKPWAPQKGELDLPGSDDRREAFAAWLISADNPYFAKVEVNRLWGHLLGRGIVEPVDDFRDSNPPAHPALLDALARDFVEHGYDRKHTIRTILNSQTYQLSSRSSEFNRRDVKYFSHARTRMLSAEQLLDAVCQVTGVPEKYAGLPAGTRAVQLPSPDVENAFLKTFGQPARETACACERSSDSNLSQALQMINGPLIHGKLRDQRNTARVASAAGKTPEEIVTRLYLAALCRKPSEPELKAAVDFLQKSEDRQRGLEDVCWAILNTNEFLFQH